ERQRQGAAESLLERRDARIGKASGIAAVAVVMHAAELAAELDDLVAVEIRRRIAERAGRHFARARKPCGTAEVQPRTRNRDLRQCDGHRRLSEVDAEGVRVDLQARIETDADSVESAADFVDQ